MMKVAFPKGSKLVLNVMSKLKNKATQNLKAVRKIAGFNGLFGLQDNIFFQKIQGTIYLIFWVNGSFNLHNSINFTNNSKKHLQIREERSFNFFESMYLMNIKMEAENGLAAAFQIWKIPKVVTRLDKVMVDFLYDLKDYDRDPENTAEITSIGAVYMLKAICIVQKTMLASPRGMLNKEDFLITKVSIFEM